MPAPKGNQNAKGNSGRPSKIDFPNETKELLKWSKKPDSIHLAAFANSRGVPGVRLYDWRDKSVEFAEAFMIAKDQLAIRLREKVNAKEYNERIGARDITAHDAMLKREERDDMAYASSLKQKEEALKVETLANLAKLAEKGDLSQK